MPVKSFRCLLCHQELLMHKRNMWQLAEECSDIHGLTTVTLVFTWRVNPRQWSLLFKWKHWSAKRSAPCIYMYIVLYYKRLLRWRPFTCTYYAYTLFSIYTVSSLVPRPLPLARKKGLVNLGRILGPRGRGLRHWNALRNPIKRSSQCIGLTEWASHKTLEHR